MTTMRGRDAGDRADGLGRRPARRRAALLAALLGPWLAAGEAKRAAPAVPAAEVAAALAPAAGVTASLVADERLVAQPVNAHVDGRGRIWVVEFRTYAKSFDQQQRDTVAVLRDGDGDGVCDARTVFHQGSLISSVAVGLGGAFVCAMPKLLFIPDRDDDGVADGAPEVLLDGWELEAKPWTNNIFGNLTWGQDGWLYGTSGMSNRGRVGRPGTPTDQRVLVGSGIWRYHPATREFEVIARGFTNCYGLVFDAAGELFVSDVGPNVISHILRGGFYATEYHPAFVPALAYERLPPVWRPPQRARHIACGAFVCDDAWPEAWCGRLLTVRGRTRSVVGNAIARTAAGHSAGPDETLLPRAADPWWFPVVFAACPSGGALLCDWSDPGQECHTFPTPERSGGRIYRLAPAGRPLRPVDLPAADDAALVAAAVSPTAWQADHARVELQRRAAEKRLGAGALAALRGRLDQSGADAVVRRRALAALIACAAIDDDALYRCAGDAQEPVAVAAIRALGDRRALTAARIAPALASGPRQRVAVAEAAMRMAGAARDELAAALARALTADDPIEAVLMAWYAIAQAPSAGDAAWRSTLQQGTANQKLAGFLGRRSAAAAAKPAP